MSYFIYFKTVTVCLYQEPVSYQKYLYYPSIFLTVVVDLKHIFCIVYSSSSENLNIGFWPKSKNKS